MRLLPMLSSKRRFLQVFCIALKLALGLGLAWWSPPLFAAEPPVLAIVGDSISAAYGLPNGVGWVALLQDRLKEKHYSYRVVNASISGDTTAGGRSRLQGLLEAYHPAIVVIEMGGNDGLRGSDLKATRANLEAMIALAKRSGAKVLLVGMRLPPNYGSNYAHQFAAMYADAAQAQKVALVPFLFQGFAERDDMFQYDRIHPVAAAQPMMLENVWPELLPLLDKPR